MNRWLSYLRGVLATVLGTCAVLWLIGWLARPDLSQRPPAYTSEQIAAAVRARDVSFDASDPAKLPNLHVDVDHAQGRAAAWWPKGEAPILSDLVAEGLLPPVDERVG